MSSQRIFAMAALFVLIALGLSRTLPVTAQQVQRSFGMAPTQEAPELPDAPAGAVLAADGFWMVPGGHQAVGDLPEDTGGPDDFGYRWDDSVALDWINASSGTDTGVSTSNNQAGPFAIGFPLKYYENTYSQLYVSRYGFLTFSYGYLWVGQSRIPDFRVPNDVIAPYWAPMDRVDGYVRYLRGGAAPNRWFAVEWNRVAFAGDGGPADVFTFETILHENGDIVFQYDAMVIDDGSACQTSGIEDSVGMDGLTITPSCSPVPGHHAVRIYRPAPAARVKVTPLAQGGFVRPGLATSFPVTIHNTGELGTDIYDLAPISNTWAATLYDANGLAPLIDTDGDGEIDTGPVGQAVSTTVTLKITAPADAPIGVSDVIGLTARSSRDTSRAKATTVQVAVPSAFVQAYSDLADRTMSLYLVEPDSQVVAAATDAGEFYEDTAMAIAAMPNGNFVYAWNRSRCLSTPCTIPVTEIETTQLDSAGQRVAPVRTLADLSGATEPTTDSVLAVAVAPDGRSGVLWRRLRINSALQMQTNMYFGVLAPDGTLEFGPVNLTNNTAWGAFGALGVPLFYKSSIAATDDNRFVLAWAQERQEPAGSVQDIWIAVRSSTGAVVKSNTNLTNDTPGSARGYVTPTLARLTAHRALVALRGRQDGGASDIYFAVLDSSGGVQRGLANLSNDSTVDYRPAAVQLSNGRTVVAWMSQWSLSYRMRFAVLGYSFNVLFGPTALDNPMARTGDDYVSATTDGANRAILTWMDQSNNLRQHLYYALVDGNGSIVTPPMIFRSGQGANPRILTSTEGYGNTTFSRGSPHPPKPVYLPLLVKR